MRAGRGRRRALAILAALAGATGLAAPCALLAQEGAAATGAASGAVWFPRVPLFRSPLAGPHAPRFAGAFVVTDILSQSSPERGPFDVNAPSTRELMAIVNLGGSYPVYRAPWRNGLIEVGGQVGMDTRFRMKLPQKDMFSADWMVALPISAAVGPWVGRVRAIHRSSHMGDQFLQATQAHRIQLGNDGFDAYGARSFGPLRVYAGGEWIGYSETDEIAIAPGQSDVWQTQAGLDVDWQPSPRWPAWSLVGGIDWQSAQRANWRPSLAAAAGVQFRQGERSARLMARAFNGASEVYQFFRTKETMYGLELVVLP